MMVTGTSWRGRGSSLNAGKDSDLSAQSGSGDRLDRSTIVLASVVVLGAIMSILDTTIVNVSLDTIGREFNASLSTIQWTVSAYSPGARHGNTLVGLGLGTASAPRGCGWAPSPCSSPAPSCVVSPGRWRA